MKFNKLVLEESETSKVGLKGIKLDRLGNMVVLIGKNGSGKTRILNFIENSFNSLSYTDFSNGTLSDVPNNIIQLSNQLNLYKNTLTKKEELEKVTNLRQTDPTDPKLIEQYKALRPEIKTLEQSLSSPPINKVNLQQKITEITNNLDSAISHIRQNYIKRINYSEIKQLQEAISDKDDEKISFEALIESVTEQSDYNELGSIYKSSLTFLQNLPHQLVYDWIDCLGDIKKFEKRVSNCRYKALKEIFEKIFGKTLVWEMRNVSKSITDKGIESVQTGLWKINDREFNYGEFSDGEKTLFVYVLLFFLMSQNKSIRLKESIIIIDEPELHLHADAEIELINGIRNIISEKGQLWIATHSINILSHANYDEVFMVKDGQINHPSKTIQREALAQLLKIEDRVQKLSEFLSSISEWTYVHFMIECFTNPEVIEIAHNNDPQVKTLKDIINLNTENKKALLLDFGAGKGRLLEQAIQDEKFAAILDYSALEPNEEFHDWLSVKGVTKIYSTYEELNDGTFDFIVLCNVLHEIPLGEWIPTLNKIISALKPTGYLLILEAKMLNKGELIGQIGYLLLDEIEIMKLFNIKDIPNTLHHKGINETITCVLLPKNQLNFITSENVLKTMKTLEERTLNKIEKIRKNTADSASNNKLGRQLAFLSQLHINSRLAQKKLQMD